MYSSDEPEYASQRLCSTIVRLNNRAVLVGDVIIGENDSLHLYSNDIVTNKALEADIDEYDLTPVPLGFVNHGHAVSYYTRKPMREDWRQGLRQNNVFIPWGYQEWSNPAIGRTINGEFPELAKPKAGFLAWHRDFCIDETGAIYYRWYGRVGNFLSVEQREYLLDAQYFWVEESLREALV